MDFRRVDHGDLCVETVVVEGSGDRCDDLQILGTLAEFVVFAAAQLSMGYSVA